MAEQRPRTYTARSHAPLHVPVLPREVVELLNVRSGGLYVDGTLGLGGHARAILEQSAPDGHLLGCDRDSEMVEHARAALASFGSRARLMQGDYRDLPEVLPKILGNDRPDGVLLDLGLNSAQLEDPQRGFSFHGDGPLDMRFDRESGTPAAEAVNRLPEHVLADLIYKYGDEPASRRIARALVQRRRLARLASTSELAEVVRQAAGRPRRGRSRIDPATRTFQALRIHVNRELEGLGPTLAALAHALASAGRLVVISFHSLEDREVKHALRELARDKKFKLLTRKPLRPDAEEVASNPRARSARLRAVARVEQAA